MKMLIGILLGFAIGIGCRWFDIPLPSPPKLIGALLVVAMTSGYILTDIPVRVFNEGALPLRQNGNAQIYQAF